MMRYSHCRSALLALFVSLPLTGASWACLNDRDSDALAIQNKRLPDALRVISGRFERNPPRYYQMRVTRLETELKANPRQFGLYDDLAVAHDRLGDDATAIRVMARKRALLPTYNAKDKTNKEAWYRYYANDGTFRAHRFLHEGAKVERIGEMRQAHAEIKRAIKIKPNAHFGREKYQLLVMKWIVATKTHKTSDSLAEFLNQRLSWEEEYWREPLSKKRQEAAQSLSGLIVLGAAWQSPDVFDALKEALKSRATVALSYLARKRRDELMKGGATSLSGRAFVDDSYQEERMYGLNEKNTRTLDALYPQLSAESDGWIRQRDQWMEAKFAQGQHPDTNATFWQSFPEMAPPSLDVEWFNEGERANQSIRNAMLIGSFIVVGVPVLLVILAVIYFRRRAIRKTSLA